MNINKEIGDKLADLLQKGDLAGAIVLMREQLDVVNFVFKGIVQYTKENNAIIFQELERSNMLADELSKERISGLEESVDRLLRLGQYWTVLDFLREIKPPPIQLINETVAYLVKNGIFTPAVRVAEIIDRKLTRQELIWLLEKLMQQHRNVVIPQSHIQATKEEADTKEADTKPLSVADLTPRQLSAIIYEAIQSSKDLNFEPLLTNSMSNKPAEKPTEKKSNPIPNYSFERDRIQKPIEYHALQAINMLPEADRKEWLVIARKTFNDSHFGEPGSF